MLSRLRSSPLLRVALALVALAFLGYGLSRNWHDSAAALGMLSWWTVAGSVVSVLAGLGFMLLAWRAVLAGFGTPLPLRVAAKVLFVGQLGKYVPGSVWAFAAMMELARDHGSPPRRTFGATVVALVTSLGCAIALAAVTLPLTSQDVARQTWYLVALIPLIVVGLHPRVLTFGLNLVLRVARKEPLDRVLPGRAMLVATGWTMIGWLVYGVHIWLLLGDMRPGGVSLYAVAAGAYALAWVTGLLTVIIPAGIGVREGAMVLVLAPVLSAPGALVVAIVSRLAFTLGDVAWAGLGFLLARGQAPEESRASQYAAQ
ncbi:lysylphosphatidylglycerol synthase transmembrane domain-containing protein [Sphaerisporangium corydalis]|uniref:Lysylphosphatidylglycerol synthase transmembrane domain-containing protein n=1 Tax=Sphaerisporangium corydalis TaxID=1441875 RepID=A0ABV9EDS3_9ACTN|nr:lysylphosphatidylglycerol synthase transmembrane domain-containing protein [Sphaerisporangium corydalis]